MLPVRLTLKGIYSYRQETVIDFAPLTKAGLFGIFGPVGSGKSTIVEAMLLALYKDSPRLLTKERGPNMMNLDSDELKVVFEFRVKDKDYRFSAEIKRKKKDPAALGTFEYGRYVWENHAWVPKNIDAQSVIGLDQDHFLRAVVIPQGKFRDFIDLGGKDRTEMMKDLFSLERYDLAEPLKTLVVENKTHLGTLNGSLREYEAVGEEKIAETQTELETAVQEQSAARLVLDAAHNEVQALNAVRELYLRLETAAAERERIEKQRPEIEKKKYELNRYRTAVETFKGPVEIADVRKKEHDAAQSRLSAANAELTRQNHAFEQARATLETLLPDHRRRDEDLRLVAALRDAANALLALAEIQKCDESIEKGRLYVEDVLKKHQSVETRRTQILQRLKDLKASLPNAQTVYEWESHYKEASAAEQAHNDALTLLAAAEKQLAAAEQALQTSQKTLDDEIRRVVGDNYDGAVPPNEALEVVVATEREKLHLLEKKSGLGAFRELLHEDQPCPLCGSTHHPQPLAPSHEPEIAAVKKRLDELGQAQNTVQKLQMSVHKAEIERGSGLREYNEKKTALAQKTEALEKIRQSLSQAPFTPAQIQEEKEKIRRIETEIKQAEAESETYEQELRTLNTTLEKAKARLADLDANKAKAMGRYEANRAKVSDAEFEQWKNQTPEALAIRADEIDGKRKSAEAAYEKAQKAVQEAESRRAGALAAHQAAQSAHQTALAAHQAAQRQLETLLHQAGETEIEIRRLLSDKPDVAKIEAEVAAFEKTAVVAAEKYLSAKSAVENLPPFDPAALHAAQQRRDHAAQTYDAAAKKVGALQQTLNDLQEKIIVKRKLEEEKKAATLVEDRLKKLEALFRANGFVQFVAAYYMHELCRLANERFRLFTQNRYEIIYQEESGELFIRDYLHSGKIRSIKTLSGGQTFQAALCLALALTTMTAGGRREFFFLDEGFGTLDGDSLSTVIEALRGLRNENCTVGLISHVERLREEIGAALYVENDPVKGSIVTMKA